MVRQKDKEFITIRIRISDHARLTKRVTHDDKIYEWVTAALDALEMVERTSKSGPGSR
ncbi:MAG: hypothetical protein ACRD47_13715 [Nitrososphaeraceae archaeon]